MYIDLNIPVPVVSITAAATSKKNKGKAPQQPGQAQQPAVTFTPAQITAIEARLDALEHCTSRLISFIFLDIVKRNRAVGYTVFALNQTVQKKLDPKLHVNTVDPLLEKLRKRQNIAFLKRLTIVLDEDSEKGFGLVR